MQLSHNDVIYRKVKTPRMKIDEVFDTAGIKYCHCYTFDNVSAARPSDYNNFGVISYKLKRDEI
jgi:hypothetical protein